MPVVVLGAVQKRARPAESVKKLAISGLIRPNHASRAGVPETDMTF